MVVYKQSVIPSTESWNIYINYDQIKDLAKNHLRIPAKSFSVQS